MAPRPPSPKGFRLTLFGGPILELPDGPRELSPFQGALLGVLAVHGRKGVTRTRLLELFWRSGTDARLRRRLSQLVYSLHRRVGTSGLVRLEGDRHVLADERLRSDLDRFRTALRQREPAPASEITRRGFLSGLRSVPTPEMERWIGEWEVRFRTELRSMALDLWSEAVRTGNWRGGEEAAAALLDLDPGSERGLRRLVEARARAGKVQEAAAAYRAYSERRRLEADGWEPADETRDLLSRLDELAARRRAARSPRRIRGGTEPPLVGREEPLRRLSEVVEDPPEAAVRTVLIEGESGIGKTRLASEVLGRAPSRGTRVLSGRGAEFERNIPLSPVVDALSLEWIRPHLNGLPDPWRTILAPLFPDLVPAGLQGAVGDEGPSRGVPVALCRAFLELFRALAGGRSLVLFLDDAHWVDPTSLAVLEYVRSRWDEGGLILLLTAREEELSAGGPLARWVRSGGSGGDVVIRLEPLSEEAIRRLIRTALESEGPSGAGDDPEGELVEEVARLSGGHPFLALEYLRHAAGGRLALPDPRARPPVPEAIERLIARRTASLSKAARHLVSCLAVHGKGVPVSVLERASGLEGTVLSAAVDEADGSRLVVVSPRGIRIRHGLIREALYQQIPVGLRLSLHRRVAEALIGSGRPGLAAEIAEHLSAGAEPDRARGYALDGARQAAAAGGSAEARALLRMALEGSPGPEESAPVAAFLARLLTLDGEFEDSETAWREAEAAYELTGNVPGVLQARLGRLEALSHRESGRRENLVDRVRSIRAEAEDRQLREVVARSMDLEARILDRLGRVEDVRAVALEAKQRAGSRGREEELEFLFVSMIEAIYGEPGAATGLAERAVELAEREGDADLLLRALNWKIIALWSRARLNTSPGRAVVDRALELAGRARDVGERFQLSANVGVWQMDTGELPAAARSFERAERILEGPRAPQLRRNLLLNRGQLALETGEPEEARECFEESLRVERQANYEPLRCLAVAGLGLTALASGRLGAAREHRAALPSHPRRWTFDPFLWLSLDVQLSRRSGRPREAIRILRDREPPLRHSVATAWMRLRILRFELSRREGLALPPEEVKELRAFLVDRRIPQRLAELDRILERG